MAPALKNAFCQALEALPVTKGQEFASQSSNFVGRPPDVRKKNLRTASRDLIISRRKTLGLATNIFKANACNFIIKSSAFMRRTILINGY